MEGFWLPSGTKIGSYVISELIGSGAFSKVYRAVHVSLNIDVALKIIPKKGAGQVFISTFHTESACLSKISHPFIIRLYETLETKSANVLVLEYLQNGSLLDYMNHCSMTKEEALKVFAQIVIALDYLHNVVRVAHRDLKPENILLDDNMNIRICDFGLAEKFDTENPTFSTFAGSTNYIAPELLETGNGSPKSDIWSAGIILYFLLFNKLPYSAPDIEKVAKRIMYTDPSFPLNADLDIIELIEKMLVKNDKERVTFADLKEAPILKDAIAIKSKFLKNDIPQYHSMTAEQKIKAVDDMKNQLQVPLNDFHSLSLSDFKGGAAICQMRADVIRKVRVLYSLPKKSRNFAQQRQQYYKASDIVFRPKINCNDNKFVF